VAGKKCFELIGRKKQCEPCATSESYRTKKPASLERYEKTLDVWFDVRAYPILDEKGNIVQVIEHLRDITPAKTSELENRRLNEQLLQAQKMESLGTLAGGIAHDFNNLLMGIQGHVSLMALSMDPDSHQLEHIKAIDEYIQSATDLTKRLLSLARIEKYEVRVIDMNELLRNSAAMFGRTRKELQIHTKTIPGPLTVAVDKRQIEQVLLNIYINAWQAMRDGGELYLETKIVNLDKAYCKPYKVRAGRYAKVSVTDTGIGMNKATLKRIFDPFFTTKKKGGGTGLGLASAYGIIKNHSGFITVYSKVGQGSTFDVYLPVSDKELLQSVHTRSGLVKGSGTVLLVDDEEMIIDVCGAMLENMGYLVIAARNGAQAVDAVRQKKHAIDLVILDLIMPGMNGGQTFDLIRDIQPNMPVILASGYAFDGLTTKAMKKGCNGFIQKPFNFSDLSQKIRKILNGTKGLAQIK
jgi:signal transduction histidine kinase/ActR/RegA family two-component response regulator